MILTRNDLGFYSVLRVSNHHFLLNLFLGEELCSENMEDIEAFTTLKGYVEGVTKNVSAHHKGVHDKLSHFKSLIDSRLEELGHNLTYPLDDQFASQGENEITKPQLNIDESNHEEKSGVLETSSAGKNTYMRA